MEAISTGSMQRLRADDRVRFNGLSRTEEWTVKRPAPNLCPRNRFSCTLKTFIVTSIMWT